jgi:hypothetical protein
MLHFARLVGSRRSFVVASLFMLLAFEASAQPAFAGSLVPPVPGKDGPGGLLAGVVNTYFPGVGEAAAGATTISLGPSQGAATTITANDLLIVIQMQGATFNDGNASSYGDGASGSGFTSMNGTGLYEYVIATNTVGSYGGSLTITGAGTSNGLINSYASSAATATSGQQTFQVIRVPQYTSATLGSTLTCLTWNGTAGGVLAIDVRDDLALGNATVSVDAMGFRGGAGQKLAGATGGANTDYVTLTSVATNGDKGEGICGTPKFLWSPNGSGGALVTTTEPAACPDGYPGGGRARGAPGNAGGGGTDAHPPANDQNTGGGGGGNWGAGGGGGRAWSAGITSGGLGGSSVSSQLSLSCLVLGGGGGSGVCNNGFPPADESAAGTGGGMIFIRTGTVTGTGTITANGGSPGNDTVNDGGGGGGAGGSIVLLAENGNWGNCTVLANGGRGGDAWDTQPAGGTPPEGPIAPGGTPAGSGFDYHGPGGGGGGGVIFLSGSQVAATGVSGGGNGLTTTSFDPFSATPGQPGMVFMNQAETSIPGAGSDAQNWTTTADNLVFTTAPQDVATNTVSGTTTLTIENAAGTPITFSSATTITLSDTSGGATFTGGNTVTIPASTSSVSFTWTDTNAGVPTITATWTSGPQALLAVSQPQQVYNGQKSLLLSAPAIAATGTQFTITVTALDPNGAVNASYTGKVSFTSSDAAAVLPASYTFTAADAGVHVFTATATTTTLETVATPPNVTQSITVSDNLGSTGGVANVFVYTAPAITSANNTSFTAGTGATYNVTTTASPLAALTETGTLPTNVVFDDSGNGSGTIVYSGGAVVAGTYPITITASNGYALTTQTFTITVVAGAAKELAFTIEPGNTTAGVDIPSLSVSVEDQFGNVVTGNTSNVTVAISNDGSDPGGGTLSGTATVAAVNGVATFTTLSINDAGTGYTLKATDGVLTAATSTAFNVASTATKLIFSTEPTNTTAGVTMSSVVVTIEDGNGSVVTNNTSNVTIAIGTNPPGNGVLSGTLTVAAVNGVATFSTLSINKAGTGYTLTAADGLLSGATSTTFNVAGPASKLAFTTQPQSTTATVTMAAVVVTVEDASGNVVTNNTSSVTLAIGTNPPGNGVLSGTLTVAAVNGVATFSTLGINKVGTGYTLTATDAGLTNPTATSNTFNITVGPSYQLAFTTEPPASTTAGVAMTSFAVSVEDKGGNVVTTDTSSVTVAIGANPGAGTLSGTATVAAVNGVATFSTLSINKAGTGYTFAAADGSLVGATSTTFNIMAATATKLVYTTAAQTVTAGGHSGATTVTAEDPFGNPSNVTQNTTIALTSTDGASNTFYSNAGFTTVVTSMPMNSGTDTVTFYWIDTKAGAPTITAAETAGQALTQATQVETVNAAAATQLVYTTAAQTVTAGGHSGATTVTAEDQYGNPSNVTQNTTIGLTSTDGASNTFYSNAGFTTVVMSMPMNSGTDTVTFYWIDTKAGTPTITAAETAGQALTQATQVETVSAAAATKLVYTTAAQTVTAGGDSGATTVTAEDQYGNPSNVTQNTTVGLTSTDGASNTFYSNAGFTTVVTSMPMNSGTDMVTFYWIDTKAGAPTITAAETAGQALTQATQVETVNAAAATKLAYTTAAQTVTAGGHSGATTVAAEDPFGNPSNVTQNTTIGLTSTDGASNTFYSNAGFTTVVTSMPMNSGTDTVTFYWIDTKAGTPTITAAETAGQALTQTTQVETVNAAAATKLVYTTAAQTVTAGGDSGATTVTAEDPFGNPSNVTQNTTIGLTSTDGASNTFYSNAGFTTVVTSMPMNTGSGAVTFYWIDTKVGTPTITAAETSGQTLTQATQGETVNPVVATTLVFTTVAQTVTAGGHSGATTVTAEDTFGNPDNVTQNTTIGLANTDGSANTFYSDAGFTTVVTSMPMNSGTNSVTFYWIDTKAGTPTITAAETAGQALTQATQVETVNPGTATKLVFTVEPTNTASLAAITPAVQVSIEDANGNVVTTATTPIGVAIGTNPASGTLSGTTSTSATNGVASYANLSIDNVGNGYTLTAQATGLPSATSTAFDITAGPGQLVFSEPVYTGVETVGNVVTVTVVRLNGAVGTVTVGYATADATAKAGTDYTATSGTLTFAPGVTSQTFGVSLLGNTGFTPFLTALLSLASPTGGAALGPQSFATLDVEPQTPISILTTSLAPGMVSSPYSQPIQLDDGGVGSTFTWSVASGSLPPGLALVGDGRTIQLAGTPSATGTFTFTVEASDDGLPGNVATKQLSVTIDAASGGNPEINALPAPPLGTLGQAYSWMATATGGAPPYTWSVVAGSLPAGVVLDQATGTIAGTPTSAGASTFSLQVTDSNGNVQVTSTPPRLPSRRRSRSRSRPRSSRSRRCPCLRGASGFPTTRSSARRAGSDRLTRGPSSRWARSRRGSLSRARDPRRRSQARRRRRETTSS